ncbi:MAG: diphosphomevalonate decarboxylase [Pseudomonadota bacterium]
MADAVRELLAHAMAEVKEAQPAKSAAPSNIALSKYWGKRDAARNLPLNSSISISLGALGSHTQVRPSDTGEDLVSLDGQALPSESAFAVKVLRFADLFRGDRRLPLQIDTVNTIPTAAGLASSASGFAALTRALCGAFGLSLDETDMSRIARLGSGSAARSIWHGFVRWNKGDAADGSDSHGVLLDQRWDDFRIAIVPVDKSEKPQSSRDGMNHTVATSPLFAPWPTQAEADCAAVEKAVRAKDFDELGPRVEQNALAMHATMLAARPPLSYLSPKSWEVLGSLWDARGEGLQAYATMDAGPNVKLIFLSHTSDDVVTCFPQASVIAPFENVPPS